MTGFQSTRKGPLISQDPGKIISLFAREQFADHGRSISGFQTYDGDLLRFEVTDKKQRPKTILTPGALLKGK